MPWAKCRKSTERTVDFYLTEYSQLRSHGVRQSMSRKGNCLDNACAEGFFGHLKDEFYRGREWPTFEGFRRDLEAYLTHWNLVRRQAALMRLPPVEYQRRMEVAWG